MSKKISLSIIFLLLILSLILYIQYQSIFKKYITLREKNEELKIENRELSQKLSENRQERERLLERIEAIQKNLDSVSKECDEYKKKFAVASRRREESIESLKLVRKENTLLKDKLTQKENEKVELEKRLKKTESEKETLNRRLVEMEKTFEARQVELPPIVVKPQELPSPGVPTPSVSGKIIAINKELNFVIIDLGEGQGIRVGRAFDVFRDQNLIGKLEVIQIRSSISACDIKQKSLDLEVGDIVK